MLFYKYHIVVKSKFNKVWEKTKIIEGQKLIFSV